MTYRQVTPHTLELHCNGTADILAEAMLGGLVKLVAQRYYGIQGLEVEEVNAGSSTGRADGDTVRFDHTGSQPSAH